MFRGACYSIGMIISNNVKRVQCKDRYPIRKSAQTAFTSPPGNPIHSDANFTSHGSIQPYCNYCAKAIDSHISITVYSQVTVMQPSELEHRGVTENAQASKWQQRGIRIRADPQP